ncbi:MAG TPA: hypothetical protein VF482_15655 [Trebonia sp.]
MPDLFTQLRVPAHWTAELHRPALPIDPAVRAAGSIGLITVGLIHVLEIQGQLSGSAWLTAGFCLLAVCAPAAGLWLLARPSSVAWQFSGVICFLAAGGYILTRSVPVPGDRSDVGNWLEPLGVAALFIEGIVAILAALVLASIWARRREMP